MECKRQSHLKSNSANQCAIIRGFALRLTLSWGKQTAPQGIKTSIKSCGQNPRAIKLEEDTRFSAMIM
ncbi:hypothetical protein T02_5840 [Trichinella nativa]|uniref:Uncharacterized protein n=1 Tax=Trichinella nativa TaxID=6335 RepID=A0A0V1LRA1_9BILA|nr:hypothetical protein T02_5840 [Trichinella nativa]